MAQTVQFDLVSPERRLASLAATEVQLPGVAGDLTAMEGHEPTITSLRPGILRVVAADGTKAFVVTGGFAEIGQKSVSVLAEMAIPLADLTAAKLDELLAEAGAIPGQDRDTAEKTLADLNAIRAAAGL